MKYQLEANKGKFFDKVFVFPIRIYYEDTDAGGIVYYANYLRFAERVRTEYLRCLGCSQQNVLEEEKCGFTVRKCEIEYLRPALFDDELIVTCEMREIKGASAIMYQEVYREDELLATINVKVAYVNLTKKRPTRIPENLIDKIA